MILKPYKQLLSTVNHKKSINLPKATIWRMQMVMKELLAHSKIESLSGSSK